ncbi:MAG: leucine-rich repeat domain-containing protein [Halioglobus sp.]|nr:leucine-rich repeat domain-containing protein [Halioglobus sp.]
MQHTIIRKTARDILISTTAQRNVFTSFALLLSSMVLSAHAAAFQFEGLRYEVVNATEVAVFSCGGICPADVRIPDTVTPGGRNPATGELISYRVTAIRDFAFVGNSVDSVTIGNNVTAIGNQAFAFNSLTSVVIPDSVTTIEEEAFRNNDLTSVTIPASVVAIGNNVFARMGTALTSAAFLGDFGAFELDMFDSNPNLSSITYLQGTAGWTQTFQTSSSPDIRVTATEVTLISLSLEEPVNGSIYSGVGNLRGFATAANGIDRVEIFINGAYEYNAPYGGRRDDVEAAFPDVGGSLLSGYSLAVGYADLGSGQHTVRAVAYDLLGNSIERSSTFNVVVFDQPFIFSNEVINLTDSTVSTLGDEIIINDATIGQRAYNLKMKWRTPEQGFEIIEIQ